MKWGPLFFKKPKNENIFSLRNLDNCHSASTAWGLSILRPRITELSLGMLLGIGYLSYGHGLGPSPTASVWRRRRIVGSSSSRRRR